MLRKSIPNWNIILKQNAHRAHKTQFKILGEARGKKLKIPYRMLPLSIGDTWIRIYIHKIASPYKSIYKQMYTTNICIRLVKRNENVVIRRQYIFFNLKLMVAWKCSPKKSYILPKLFIKLKKGK